MSWDRLAELVKEDSELSLFVESNKGKIDELSQANKQMAEAIEGKDRVIKEQGDERKTLREKVSTLEDQVKNTPSDTADFQKQIQQIKSDYESKLAENTGIVDSLKKDKIELMRSMQFSDLNLAAKLPSDWSEDQVKSAVEFMKFELSKGLEYNEDGNAFVYMADGVPSINPDTAKPYTIADVAKSRIESGAWNHLVGGNPNSGADRGGNVEGGKVTPKSVTRDAFDAMENNQRMDFIKGGGTVEN